MPVIMGGGNTGVRAKTKLSKGPTYFTIASSVNFGQFA